MTVVTYRIISRDGTSRGYRDDFSEPLYVPVSTRSRYAGVDNFGYLPPLEQPPEANQLLTFEPDSQPVKAVVGHG